MNFGQYTTTFLVYLVMDFCTVEKLELLLSVLNTTIYNILNGLKVRKIPNEKIPTKDTQRPNED